MEEIKPNQNLIKLKQEEKMNNTTQMEIGTWDNISTEDYERKDKVTFDLNKPQRVTITNPNPRELTGQSGVFYLFEVEHENKPKVICTSAWTLVKSLKKAQLTTGKILDITKKIVKGKQVFDVTEVKK